MGIAEMLAEKDTRAQRRLERYDRLTGPLAVVPWLVVAAGWMWTAYLAFFEPCASYGYGRADCGDRTWDTVRVGLATVLVTVSWLYARTAARLRRLEHALAVTRPEE
ncbi:hypothetical protein [Kitasatospora sp. NPDC101183]|uniref:hypothetical protein n=1 Tax=Kitasatospora sp. NPDC101183 TaxID=3364100 RepID=UPI00380353A8